MSKSIQFVVIETSDAESRWFHHYTELLHHFSYWASMWWLTNAPVQRQQCVDTSATPCLYGDRVGTDHSAKQFITDDQKQVPILSGLDASESSFDDFWSCGGSECESACSEQGAWSTVASGSKFFTADFDEHACEDTDYQEPVIPASCGMDSGSKASGVYGASCSASNVDRWPRRRAGRRRGKKGSRDASRHAELPNCSSSGDESNHSDISCPTSCHESNRSDMDQCGRCGRHGECAVLPELVPGSPLAAAICGDCARLAFSRMDGVASDSDGSENDGMATRGMHEAECGLCGEFGNGCFAQGTFLCFECDAYERRLAEIEQQAEIEQEDYKGTAEVTLQVGHIIELKGLMNAPQLNGCKGKLVEWHPQNSRWVVSLSNGSGQKLIKPSNLVAVGWSDEHAPRNPRDNDFVCSLCSGPCSWEDLQICPDCEKYFPHSC